MADIVTTLSRTIESSFHEFYNLAEYVRFNHQITRCKRCLWNTRSVIRLLEDDDYEPAVMVDREQHRSRTGYGYNNWNEPDIDIMQLIIQRLAVRDLIRMCNVCKSWRSIAMQRDIGCRPQLPWLLLPRDSDCKHVSFFNMSEGKIQKFNIPKLIQGGWCRGSSKGWLVIATGTKTKPHIFLFNPISGVHVELPPITTIPSFDTCEDDISKPYNFTSFITKIELSSEDASTCIISATFDISLVLAACRADHKGWTVFSDPDDSHQHYYDILFSNGMLYVLRESGNLVSDFIMELPDCQLNLIVIPEINLSTGTAGGVEYLADFSIGIDFVAKQYLVESNGDLFIVESSCNHFLSNGYDAGDEEDDNDNEIHLLSYYQVSKLYIYKMIIHSSGNFQTSRLDCLGDRVLFVGNNSTSLSLLARDYNELKGNCVYFLEGMGHYAYDDHYPYVCRESGLFHLDDGKIKRCFPSISHPLQMMHWFAPPQHPCSC